MKRRGGCRREKLSPTKNQPRTFLNNPQAPERSPGRLSILEDFEGNDDPIAGNGFVIMRISHDEPRENAGENAGVKRGGTWRNVEGNEEGREKLARVFITREATCNPAEIASACKSSVIATLKRNCFDEGRNMRV